ncbi:MAG TPA: hypothetical protein VEP46_16820 [Vicinamibacterales bacterium]|nr:hypothetical protein [Vicinamibacterales bacterium]
MRRGIAAASPESAILRLPDLAEPGRFHLPLRLLVFGVEAIDRQIRPKTHAGDADYALGYFIDARKR